MPPRLTPIVVAVVCAHALALWALQSGLRQETPAAATPVVMVASLIAPPPPEAKPSPQPAPPLPPPISRPKPPQPQVAPPPEPKPRPLPSPAPSVPAPSVSDAILETAPQTPVETSPAAATAAAPSLVIAVEQPSAPSLPDSIELPTRAAKHLNNPPPPYPAISRRMGESGRVLIYARIEANGTASQARIKTSSGYERLDQAALQAVLRWRFIPGKRAGVPEAMWYDIPLDFVLQ
jgi:periplasmic protein TonB